MFPAHSTGIRLKRHLALRLGGLIPAYPPVLSFKDTCKSAPIRVIRVPLVITIKLLPRLYHPHP